MRSASMVKRGYDAVGGAVLCPVQLGAWHCMHGRVHSENVPPVKVRGSPAPKKPYGWWPRKPYDGARERQCTGAHGGKGLGARARTVGGKLAEAVARVVVRGAVVE